jgi:hypothetical protein
MTRDKVDAETGETVVTGGGRDSIVREAIGCAVPLLVLVSFLFLVMWGYRVLFVDEPGAPIEAGELRSLEVEGSSGFHSGRRCRVYSDWIVIELDGEEELIPRDRVRSLRLATSR